MIRRTTRRVSQIARGLGSVILPLASLVRRHYLCGQSPTPPAHDVLHEDLRHGLQRHDRCHCAPSHRCSTTRCWRRRRAVTRSTSVGSVTVIAFGSSKVDATTGVVDQTFNAKVKSGRVLRADMVNGRLIVGGSFSKKLMALNPTGQALTPATSTCRSPEPSERAPAPRRDRPRSGAPRWRRRRFRRFR